MFDSNAPKPSNIKRMAGGFWVSKPQLIKANTSMNTRNNRKNQPPTQPICPTISVSDISDNLLKTNIPIRANHANMANGIYYANRAGAVKNKR